MRIPSANIYIQESSSSVISITVLLCVSSAREKPFPTSWKVQSQKDYVTLPGPCPPEPTHCLTLSFLICTHTALEGMGENRSQALP